MRFPGLHIQVEEALRSQPPTESRKGWNSVAMEGELLFCRSSPRSPPTPRSLDHTPPQVYLPSHTPQGTEGTFSVFC